MTGCMICSSLSIAPAWAIAARSDFVDLDGPLWLSADRAGGVTGAGEDGGPVAVVVGAGHGHGGFVIVGPQH